MMKIVFITGAAQGFGEVIALDCAKDGAKVIACDQASCKETVAKIQEAGGEAYAISYDITDYAACEAAISEAREILRQN